MLSLAHLTPSILPNHSLTDRDQLPQLLPRRLSTLMNSPQPPPRPRQLKDGSGRLFNDTLNMNFGQVGRYITS